MAETPQPMSSKDAGNATGSSLKARRAPGALGVPAVNLKINQDEFASALDSLIGLSKGQGGCSVGKITRGLPEPARSKFKEALVNDKINSARLVEVLATFEITVGSDVMRRHRRRLLGKDGCMCPREP